MEQKGKSWLDLSLQYGARSRNVGLSILFISEFEERGVRKFRAEGSIGHAFTFCIRTGDQNQVSFYPFVLREISDLSELTLGHLRYYLEDMPPQPNSLPENFFYDNSSKMKFIDRISTNTIRVVVFHC